LGLFSGLKSNYKKSEAAVVVQKLLESQANLGFFSKDPAFTANTLVAAAWDYKPDIFDGKFGQRPHKISVAAYAIANGIPTHASNRETQLALFISLGNILSELETNGRLYQFNNTDQYLLESATSIYMSEANRSSITTQSKPKQPNIKYAADGFAHIYSLKNSTTSTDLHNEELKYSKILLNNGCTHEEALSARFGGVLAINVEEEFVRAFFAAYDESKTGNENLGTQSEDERKIQGAAIAYLTLLLGEHPDEYEIFLKHINSLD